MADDVPIGQAISIRDTGVDEYWLQDQICDNPACLGLGDLEVISKEHPQSSGGRLDILLKNPEDDSMYEVEVMLGDTDESHIIRTIEYWDNEKRRWPQRQHYAVLVAESITRRFFNVIQLLSHVIPIVAIQVNIIETPNQRTLFFSKVLDTYAEIDDGSSFHDQSFDETYWSTKAPWTLETAKCMLQLFSQHHSDCRLHFVKNYVAINMEGKHHFTLRKRSNNKSLLSFRMADKYLDEATVLLDQENISYVHQSKSIRITIDEAMVRNHSVLFFGLLDLRRKSWHE